MLMYMERIDDAMLMRAVEDGARGLHQRRMRPFRHDLGGVEIRDGGACALVT